VRLVADPALRPLQAFVEQRLDRLEERLVQLASEVTRLAGQVELLHDRVEATSRELVRMTGEQVDGANDANEALGRVLAGLRSELTVLTDAIKASTSGGQSHRR
jgi:uncharacterized coiled-coil protein SlyX